MTNLSNVVQNFTALRFASAALSLTLLLATALFGDDTREKTTTNLEFWVDKELGNDHHAGTHKSPFQTIAAGLKELQPGSILHVLPNASPWSGDIRITVSGTADKPIVIDGHGSIVSNRRNITPEEWDKVDEGVYSRKLPNNAWGMESHWEGGFPLVWFNGVAALNVASKSKLKPGSYFLYKNRKDSKNDSLHNTLFISLPIEATLESVTIKSIAGESGIFVGGNHVIVRNFIAEYGGRDGFATHRNKGVVFQNVEARHFMDQGISQHGAEVIVRNSHFHHNAGAGIVDVYPEARVRYENCIIEDNTWRGGVEFHSGTFHLIDCTIRNNNGPALTVTKNATATLERCKISSPQSATGPSIRVGPDATLIVKGSVIGD